MTRLIFTILSLLAATGCHATERPRYVAKPLPPAVTRQPQPESRPLIPPGKWRWETTHVSHR